jgi:hypothetical protein
MRCHIFDLLVSSEAVAISRIQNEEMIRGVINTMKFMLQCPRKPGITGQRDNANAVSDDGRLSGV